MNRTIDRPPTPPTTPRSSKKLDFPAPKDENDGIRDTILTEYETLNAQLRRRIQDYEIALLKMQLRERDKELQAILQARQRRHAENQVTELVLKIARQEEQIEMLSTQVNVWKSHALEARDMLEQTYHDLAKVP
ncbi:hypothetical protein EK21DRAFT_117032 [Setomelanomma holmii]|uniref:Uncharacterized protein n=1 Tax=Setomelanomma holmii TaxID=210430 RepID=A0A9P4LG54_9PLEO|nr:hypothetical protein EK21DRAFT_117032 [Setomelanomma holmii]